MKIMVIGDLHGETPWATRIIKNARRHGAKKAIVVGDFGLWDHFEEGVRFLDSLNDSLRHDGVKLYAVGGNHENWVRWNWYVENNPQDQYGFTYLRSHIMLMPKVFQWDWEGKRFGSAGGAVSIDRDWRLAREKESGLGPNTLFWWDEQFTDKDLAEYPTRKVDYLFTHDCSNSTPWRNRLKPDFESQMHRQRIDGVLKKARPEMHFHGHMHTKYDWMNLVGDNHWTQTYGLECNGMFWNWGILDTDSDEFEFAPPSVKPTLRMEDL
jgi:hypothetical protein